MNNDLKKAPKIDFEKGFFKLMSNSVFKKTMKKVRKHRDIKFITTENRRNLVSEQNFHTIKFFTENLLSIEVKIKKQKKQKCVTKRKIKFEGEINQNEN